MNASLYLKINAYPCIIRPRQPQCWYMFYRSDLPPIVTDYVLLFDNLVIV